MAIFKKIATALKKRFHRCYKHIVPAEETSRIKYYCCAICGKRYMLPKSKSLMSPDQDWLRKERRYL